MFSPDAPPAELDLPVITIPPTPPHPHTHTVVFLHGRGDNTRSFTRALHAWYSSYGETLFTAFPTVRWVFPQAPRRPVASTGGAEVMPQWFDVWTPRDFSAREDVQVPGLREAVPAVARLVAAEAAALGGRFDRVVLAGISMGAATGVHTLLNLDLAGDEEGGGGGGRLGAFMGFCARCPFAGRSLAEMRAVLALPAAPVGDGNGVLSRTPVLLEHNRDDPLVKVERGRELRDTLRGFGAQVEWREYETGLHWFKDPEGLDDVIEFLGRVVRGNGGGEGERAGGGGQAQPVADPEAMEE